MRKRSEEATLWIACAVTLAIMWAAVIFTAFELARVNAREKAAVAASTAKGFAEYVSLNLLALDKLLLESREAYGRRGAAPRSEELASSLGPIAPTLLQIAFADASGAITGSSLPFEPGLRVADRPHFLEFQHDPRDRPFLSQPVTGRVSGRMSLQFVRPLLGPAGEFRGIAVASIDPGQFHRYFGSVDAFAEGGTVVIAGRTDGIVRTRFSGSQMNWGQSLKKSKFWGRLSTEESGTYETRSAIDHQLRTVGFHEVAGFPLVVLVSSKKASWLSPGIALALALALAFTALHLGYTRSRVLRARAQSEFIAQMERARQRELEAQRMKSGFISSVSHELKTPLNTIVGFSEILTEAPDTAEASGFARRIHDSALQLQEMVDSLLAVARAEAGDMVAASVLVDLPAAMRGVVAAHRRAAEARGLSIDVRCDLPRDKTVLASVDRAAFVQVLGNILSAVLRTTAAGGVQLVAREAQGSFIVDVASDAAVQEELRAARSHELASALGASLTFRDGPGPGSRLTLRLPRVRLSQSIP